MAQNWRRHGGLPATAFAAVGVFISAIDTPAGVAALAGISGRDFFYRNPGQSRLVAHQLLQLVKRPVIAVLPGIRFPGFVLPRRLTDTAQIFETNTSPLPFVQRHDVFTDHVIDRGDNVATTAGMFCPRSTPIQRPVGLVPGTSSDTEIQAYQMPFRD